MDEYTCKSRINYTCSRIASKKFNNKTFELLLDDIALVHKLVRELPKSRDVLIPVEDVTDSEMAESFVLTLREELSKESISWLLVLSILVQLLDRIRQ